MLTGSEKAGLGFAWSLELLLGWIRMGCHCFSFIPRFHLKVGNELERKLLLSSKCVSKVLILDVRFNLECKHLKHLA